MVFLCGTMDGHGWPCLFRTSKGRGQQTRRAAGPIKTRKEALGEQDASEGLSEMQWQNCKISFPQKNVFHHWELPWYILNMSQIYLNMFEQWTMLKRILKAWISLKSPSSDLFSESNFQVSNMKQPQLQTIFNPGLINSVDSEVADHRLLPLL